MKILLIEDEAFHRTLYRSILKQQGHKVIIAEDAEEGLEYFYQSISYDNLIKEYKSSFDVIILDVFLPDKSGVNLAKEIFLKTPHQRVVFVTAYVKELLAESLKEFKQKVSVLEKPFPLEELVDTVENSNEVQKLEKTIKTITNSEDVYV